MGNTKTEIGLKIEPGKFYRTRLGDKVRVYAIDGGGSFSIHGAIFTNRWVGGFWKPTGEFDGSDIYNIVSECPPVQRLEDIGFDPTCLPRWSRYIAMDRDGEWWAYDDLPINFGMDSWASTDRTYSYVKIPPEFEPENFRGDWKDSLFEVSRQ